MKKLVFLKFRFYVFVIAYLTVLKSLNIYAIFSGNLIGLIPLTIQVVLLFLLIKKHSMAKIGLKIFSIVVLIIASSLKLISALLKILIGEYADLNFFDYLSAIMNLILGIVILYFTNKSIKIEEKGASI